MIKNSIEPIDADEILELCTIYLTNKYKTNNNIQLLNFIYIELAIIKPDLVRHSESFSFFLEISKCEMIK